MQLATHSNTSNTLLIWKGAGPEAVLSWFGGIVSDVSMKQS